MKSVAIVGFASSSRHLAPVNDDRFEIWTMNHAPLTWIPKWHVLFEMHPLEHLRKITAHGTDPGAYLDWLRKQPGPDDPKHCPIYMLDRVEEFPASVAFPRAEINAWLAERCGRRDGYFAADYYTSTISYMLALAIMQMRPEIHLYGIDLLQDDEYIYQRAGAEYLIGLARGMGLEVYIPPQSALCSAGYTYGYTADPEGLGAPSKDVVTKLLSDLEKTLAEGGDAKAFVAQKVAELNGNGNGNAAKAPAINLLAEYIADKAVTCEDGIARTRQDAHTFNGAMQMADLVLGWLEKNGDGEKDMRTLVQEKKAELQKKFQTAHEGTFLMQGQAEAFKTAAIWSKHVARGGALKL